MGTMIRVPAQTSQAECWREWFGVGARLLARDVLAILDLVMTWQDRADQRRHLNNLSDRMLADIGLCRADIQAELRKPFWCE